MAAREIVVKYEQNFFLKDLMVAIKSKDKVKKSVEGEDEVKDQDEEERKQPMDQSFYRKQGLDFLSFQRPGTAYGSFMNKTQSSGFGASRTQGFFDPNASRIVRPSAILEQRANSKANSSSLSQLWFTRAEKVMG